MAALILVDGDPLADIAILSDASRIVLVAMSGLVVKDAV